MSIHAAALTVALFVSPFPEQDANSPRPASVEISPSGQEAEVGQRLTLSVVAYDDSRRRIEGKPSAWFAAPFDVVSVDESGAVTFHAAGQAKIGVLFNGRRGSATFTVKPARVSKVMVTAPRGPIPTGTGINLQAMATTAVGDPRTDVTWTWVSSDTRVATVDAGGFATGIAPGKATIRATAGGVTGEVAVDVIQNPVRLLSIEPKTIQVRTGDVVRLKPVATGSNRQVLRNPVVRWAVSGPAASVDTDGVFVAEKPGAYAVTAVSGDRSAVSNIQVTVRNVERELEVVGRTEQEDTQTAEQWLVGNYAYLSSIGAGKLWVYDMSEPGTPKKKEALSLDARVINDVSTTPDGKIGVVTREGASNRKNGIVFLDLADPAKPVVLSEYTETVTGGVHSAYIDGHYVYLTDDATGSMRVIDFRDPRKPREVARWEAPNPTARTIRTAEGDVTSGRYLHDVQVVDGLCYMGYWRDGLVILDVGNGIKGGSPEKPMFVSQIRFNYHELYGNGWVAGAHAVFRYKNYVFIGDEVFPENFDLSSRERIPVKGIVHIVDVSDILNPRKVAQYEVPEAGAHNMWVENDVMYIGYYNGGGRVVDVSGELRGELYRQGREMARLWTGDSKGFRPNLPFTWGAQPHRGLIYFNDIHTGIWATRLIDPKDKGK